MGYKDATMARLQRFCPAGMSVHIIQRGNNRSVCFASENDFITYAHYLKTYAEQFRVAVHAWVWRHQCLIRG